MKHPADLAFTIIEDVMFKGSTKDGKDGSWRDKSQDYHLDRALRHAITYKMIRDGNAPQEDENHLHNALTRLAMALCVS